MTVLNSTRSSRALTILEVVMAMAILTVAVILFGSGMIAATRAEAKAAGHTQAIMIGNYLLEQVRRDPTFWDTTSSGEYNPACPAGNCWQVQAPSNQDSNGNLLPPYDDSLATAPSNATWHTGFVPLDAPKLVLPPYHYIWRADPIDQKTFGGVTKGVAAITIELYIDQQGTQDVYVAKGMNRLQ